MVPIIDTLPSTQTNSAKEDGDIAQENYFSSEMFQDLKNQRTIFEPDASRSEKSLKANQPKNFSYPKKKFGKEERSFLPSWYDKWAWLHYDEAEDSAYCIIYIIYCIVYCIVYYEITKLVKFSPKLDSHLRKIHKEEYYENEESCSSKFTTLRLFSGTRWTLRPGSLTNI